MAIIAKQGGESSFTPVSEGLHPAVCWAVVDLGIQQKGGLYPGEAHQVYLGFEVLDQQIEFEKDGQKQVGPMRIGITLTNSLGEKAKLRKFLEKWRGRAFTEDELKGFDLTTIAGHPCQILVTHAHKGDRTYANVENILGWPKGTPRPPAPESLLVHELGGPQSLATLARLPEWLQGKVEERLANDWEEFNAKGKASASAQEPADAFDDSIPF